MLMFLMLKITFQQLKYITDYVMYGTGVYVEYNRTFLVKYLFNLITETY